MKVFEIRISLHWKILALYFLIVPYFVFQLWPGTLFMKGCLPVEDLMALCCSGTLGMWQFHQHIGKMLVRCASYYYTKHKIYFSPLNLYLTCTFMV